MTRAAGPEQPQREPEREPLGEPRLDVILALRRAVQVFWLDFVAVILAGVLLVTLPGALTRRLPDT